MQKETHTEPKKKYDSKYEQFNHQKKNKIPINAPADLKKQSFKQETHEVWFMRAEGGAVLVAVRARKSRRHWRRDVAKEGKAVEEGLSCQWQRESGLTVGWSRWWQANRCGGLDRKGATRKRERKE